MSHPTTRIASDSPEAAARIIARLVVRDDRVDWREIDFLDRSGAFTMLKMTRHAFMQILARSLGERLGRRASGAPARRFDDELDAIGDRRLQLVVAALLVYVSEIDRDVQTDESALVRRVFKRWQITPQLLQCEMRIPLERSLAALGRLGQAA